MLSIRHFAQHLTCVASCETSLVAEVTLEPCVAVFTVCTSIRLIQRKGPVLASPRSVAVTERTWLRSAEPRRSLTSQGPSPGFPCCHLMVRSEVTATDAATRGTPRCPALHFQGAGQFYIPGTGCQGYGKSWSSPSMPPVIRVAIRSHQSQFLNL